MPLPPACCQLVLLPRSASASDADDGAEAATTRSRAPAEPRAADHDAEAYTQHRQLDSAVPQQRPLAAASLFVDLAEHLPDSRGRVTVYCIAESLDRAKLREQLAARYPSAALAEHTCVVAHVQQQQLARGALRMRLCIGDVGIDMVVMVLVVCTCESLDNVKLLLSSSPSLCAASIDASCNCNCLGLLPMSPWPLSLLPCLRPCCSEVLHASLPQPAGCEPCDVFFFEFGVICCWGLTAKQESELLGSVAKRAQEQPLPRAEVEVDEFEVAYSSTSPPSMQNDTITISRHHANDAQASKCTTPLKK